jgi:hypothetical protein
MPTETSMTSRDRIAKAILLMRGERVMLDAALAPLYGVSVKALNQAVPQGFHVPAGREMQRPRRAAEGEAAELQEIASSHSATTGT